MNARPIAPPLPSWLAASPSSGRAVAVEIAELWGDSLVALRHVTPAAPVTLGDSARCSLFVPADRLPDPASPFPLVTFRRDEPILHLSSTFGGAIERNGDSLPFGAWLARGAADAPVMLAERPLAPGERARIELGGGLVLLVQRVARQPALPAAILDLDRGVAAVFASLLSLALVLAAVARALASFSPAPAATDALTRAGDVLLKIDLPEPLPTPPPSRRSLVRPDPEAGDRDAGAGAKMRGEEGRAGKKDGKKPPKHDARRVGDHGVLAALPDAETLTKIFGTGPESGILDTELLGLVAAATDGSGPGWGVRGDDEGGGGERPVPGLGPEGLLPGGGRRGHGRRPGELGPGDGKKRASIAVSVVEEVVTIGMDPELIDLVVRKHLPQMQACYETRLQRDSTLHGKVLMGFTIAGDGMVTAASVDASSSLQDAEVSRCLVARFRAIRFPAPPGRGTVAVRYPLLFKSAGR